jgi:hypothetical protein
LIKGIFPGAGNSVTLINGAPPPQPPGDIEWLRQFGGFAPASNNLARAVDTDGSVYIAGQVRGALPGQTSVGGDDAFVRKYDAAGNEVWTYQFGTPGLDQAMGRLGRLRRGVHGGRSAGPEQRGGGIGCICAQVRRRGQRDMDPPIRHGRVG